MKSILKKFLWVLIYKINPHIIKSYNRLFDFSDIDGVIAGEIFDQTLAGVDEILQTAAGSVSSFLDQKGDCEGVGRHIQVSFPSDCDRSVQREGGVLLPLLWLLLLFLLAEDGGKQENDKRL